MEDIISKNKIHDHIIALVTYCISISTDEDKVKNSLECDIDLPDGSHLIADFKFDIIKDEPYEIVEE